MRGITLPFGFLSFDDSLQHRLRDLGERKEELTSAEHEELLAPVQFAEARTREKLEAELALRRLKAAAPALVSML